MTLRESRRVFFRFIWITSETRAAFLFSLEKKNGFEVEKDGPKKKKKKKKGKSRASLGVNWMVEIWDGPDWPICPQLMEKASTA